MANKDVAKQVNPWMSLAVGFGGVIAALIGIFLGNTVANMTGGEHAEHPAVHESEH